MRASTLEQLRQYVDDGAGPNAFLYSCLANNLIGAGVNARNDDLEELKDICCWILSEVPPMLRGSPPAVNEWIAANHANRLASHKQLTA